MEEHFKRYKIVVFNCGMISPEASGWFRKEIKTVEDLKGLKMRFLGLGANVMQKLGVATQLLQAGEIFQALQLGTIDATEFSMPAMDYALGFHQVAKFYYFPGWHQMSTLDASVHLRGEMGGDVGHPEGHRQDDLRRADVAMSSPTARPASSRCSTS